MCVRAVARFRLSAKVACRWAGTDVGKYRELDSKSKSRGLVVCRSGWQPGKMDMENRTDLQ